MYTLEPWFFSHTVHAYHHWHQEWQRSAFHFIIRLAVLWAQKMKENGWAASCSIITFSFTTCMLMKPPTTLAGYLRPAYLVRNDYIFIILRKIIWQCAAVSSSTATGRSCTEWQHHLDGDQHNELNYLKFVKVQCLYKLCTLTTNPKFILKFVTNLYLTETADRVDNKHGWAMAHV